LKSFQLQTLKVIAQSIELLGNSRDHWIWLSHKHLPTLRCLFRVDHFTNHETATAATRNDSQNDAQNDPPNELPNLLQPIKTFIASVVFVSNRASYF
jgi:hypothetical protein